MCRSRLAMVVAIVMCLSFTFSISAASTRRNKHKNKYKEVEIANLNLLHGFDCDPAFDPELPDRGNQCRLSDRVDLLFKHLAAIGCPDIVTLQEIVDRPFVPRGAEEIVGPLESAKELIEAKLEPLAAVCGFQYELLYLPVPDTFFEGTDEELILSRYPIVEAESRLLHSALFQPEIVDLQFFARHVLFARIDHPVGPIDVFTTHLSSGSDFADNDCNSTVTLDGGFELSVPCPPECVEAEVRSVRECQALQLALFVEERHDVSTPAYVSGDMNASPGSTEYETFVGRGWVDTHLAAGNPECDPTTGEGCPSGRDEIGGDLEVPEPNVDERIDFVFLVPADKRLNCKLVRANKRRSGLFAAEPNPFVDVCGQTPLPICWASDHNGNVGNVRCPKRPHKDDD